MTGQTLICQLSFDVTREYIPILNIASRIFQHYTIRTGSFGILIFITDLNQYLSFITLVIIILQY